MNPPFFTTLISIFSCPHLSAQRQTSPIPACRVTVGSRLLARSLGHTTKGRDWAGMGRGGKTLLGSGLGNPGGPPGRRGPNSTEGWGWGVCSDSLEMPDCICFIAPEITQRKPRENRAAGWRLRGLCRAAGASRGGNTGRAPGPPGLGDGGYGTSELHFIKGPETWTDGSSRVVPAGRAGELSPTGPGPSWVEPGLHPGSTAELGEGRGLPEAVGLTGQWFPQASTSTDRMPDPRRQLCHSTKSQKWSLSTLSAFTDIAPG